METTPLIERTHIKIDVMRRYTNDRVFSAVVPQAEALQFLRDMDELENDYQFVLRYVDVP